VAKLAVDRFIWVYDRCNSGMVNANANGNVPKLKKKKKNRI
jgi:hypothetical protein